MARIRNLKPEFWTDGNIVQLSFAARLFYQGTWNFALCDRGHLPDDPMELKLRILPADEIDPAELVEELLKFGRLVRETTPSGKRYLRIVRLPDHNKADPRWSPRCPYCSAESAETPRNSGESLGVSPKLPDTPSSDTVPHENSQKEGKGREGKGEEGKETSAKPPTDDAPPRVDVERLCNHLADRVESNGSKRPKVTKAWRDSARLLLDRDSRTEEQVHAAIDWCQDNDFWHRNILSMPKLREKYEQLQLAAKPSRPGGRPTNQHVESTAGDQLAEVFG